MDIEEPGHEDAQMITEPGQEASELTDEDEDDDLSVVNSRTTSPDGPTPSDDDKDVDDASDRAIKKDNALRRRNRGRKAQKAKEMAPKRKAKRVCTLLYPLLSIHC